MQCYMQKKLLTLTDSQCSCPKVRTCLTDEAEMRNCIFLSQIIDYFNKPINFLAFQLESFHNIHTSNHLFMKGGNAYYCSEIAARSPEAKLVSSHIGKISTDC